MSVVRVSRPARATKKMIQRTETIKFSANSFVAQHAADCCFEDVFDVDYENDMIEKGDKSTIYKCCNKESGEEFAVKRIEKSKWNDDENDKISKEIELLRTLDHPNIINIYATFEDETHKFIVMDCCRGGELLGQMFRGSGFSEYYTAVLIKTLMSTVNYFFSKHQVVHLGLKPENILLEGHRQMEQLRVIDFGSAIVSPSATKLDHLVGNPQYLAPESLEYCKYSHKTDMWAIGVIAFACLSGKLPFDAPDDRETLELIMNCKEEVESKKLFTGPDWEGVSDDAIDLIAKLLAFEQFKRPSAKEALNHPWIHRVTEAQAEVIQKRDAVAAKLALNNLFQFHAPSKLQQAALTYIASQLLSKSDTDAFDNFYQAVDFNGAGKLTKENLKKAYSIFLEEDLADSEVDDLFVTLDVNCSKFVEYTEWLVAALPEDTLLSEDNLQKTFAAFDKDGDGNISAEDLKQVLGFFLDVSDDRMDLYIRNKILKQVETGEDGQITYEVFVDMLRKTKNGPGRDPNAAKVAEDAEVEPSIVSGNLFAKYKMAFERNGGKS